MQHSLSAAPLGEDAFLQCSCQLSPLLADEIDTGLRPCKEESVGVALKERDSDCVSLLISRAWARGQGLPFCLGVGRTREERGQRMRWGSWSLNAWFKPPLHLMTLASWTGNSSSLSLVPSLAE